MVSSGRSNGPSVSVIIPTHNRAGLLLEAIESVRQQTYHDYELIVIDDGSTDDTERELQRSVSESSRISYVGIEHTGFPGLVRNRGIEAARGRYVAFLDSDDLWKPQKLERQVSFLNEGRFRISHTDELWLRDGRTVSQASRRHRRHGDLFEESLVKCIIGPSTTMIERELLLELGGFREDLEVCEDYELWLRVCARVEVGHVAAELTIKRAGHGDQLSEKYGQIERFRIVALRDALIRGEIPSQDDGPATSVRTGTSTLRHTGPAPLSKRRLAEFELARKCRIYAKGARKRGRSEEADGFDRLADDAERGSLEAGGPEVNR